MKYRRFSLMAVSCIAAVLAGGCSRRAADPAAPAPVAMPTLEVVSVGRGTMEQVLPVTGTLATLPNMEANLVPQVSGTLEALPIRFGQSVMGGQIVAQISALPLMGQIQQAEATYGQSLMQVEQAQANAIQQTAQTKTTILQAQASLRNAQAALAAANAVLTGDVAAAQNARENVAREQTLYNDGLVSQRDLESAQLSVQTSSSQADAQKQTVEAQRETVAGQAAALAAAKAGSIEDQVKRKDIEVARQQVSNALGALNSTRAQLALYTIRAPLSGDITAIGAGVGELVDSTTKLATISNLDRLQLVIAAPTSLARSIRPGDPVVFTAESFPGKQFHTLVETVSPQVDPVSGSVPVLATVANPGHLLKDDVSVSVEIITARHAGAIMVPAAAVLSDADTGEKSVMTVDSHSVAHVVAITTGIENGGSVEILSGLSPGERVACAGQYGIADGTTVHAQPLAAGQSGRLSDNPAAGSVSEQAMTAGPSGGVGNGS